MQAYGVQSYDLENLLKVKQELKGIAKAAGNGALDKVKSDFNRVHFMNLDQEIDEAELENLLKVKNYVRDVGKAAGNGALDKVKSDFNRVHFMNLDQDFDEAELENLGFSLKKTFKKVGKVAEDAAPIAKIAGAHMVGRAIAGPAGGVVATQLLKLQNLDENDLENLDEAELENLGFSFKKAMNKVGGVAKSAAPIAKTVGVNMVGRYIAGPTGGVVANQLVKLQNLDEAELENLGYLTDAVKYGKSEYAKAKPEMKEKAKEAFTKADERVTKVVNDAARFTDRRVIPKAETALEKAKKIAERLQRPKVAVPVALLI